MTAALSDDRDVDLLSQWCPVRLAGPFDQARGLSVRFVVSPRTLDEVSAVMRHAHEASLIVLPIGTGSKLAWSEPPPVVDVLLDMSAFDSCRYDADSTWLTVGAATPVAAAQDVLAPLGRRLVLDPPSLRASVGGVLVTGECGPLTYRFGPPAAHVVDATVVLPDGSVSTVADRERLLGSAVCDLRWAAPTWPHRASVVVNATLRTYPQPPAQVWITCPVTQPLQISRLLDDVLAANVSPVAMELDMPGMRRLDGGGLSRTTPMQRGAAGAVAMLLEGAPASLADRARILLSRLGAGAYGADQQPVWWGRYPFRSDEIALRLTIADSEAHSCCYALADAVGAPVPVRGNVNAGTLWAAIPADMPAVQLRRVLETVREVLLSRGGSAVVQAAPGRLHSLIGPYREP